MPSINCSCTERHTLEEAKVKMNLAELRRSSSLVTLVALVKLEVLPAALIISLKVVKVEQML
jgi:hypothetical protein